MARVEGGSLIPGSGRSAIPGSHRSAIPGSGRSGVSRSLLHRGRRSELGVNKKVSHPLSVLFLFLLAFLLSSDALSSPRGRIKDDRAVAAAAAAEYKVNEADSALFGDDGSLAKIDAADQSRQASVASRPSDGNADQERRGRRKRSSGRGKDGTLELDSAPNFFLVRALMDAAIDFNDHDINDDDDSNDISNRPRNFTVSDLERVLRRLSTTASSAGGSNRPLGFENRGKKRISIVGEISRFKPCLPRRDNRTSGHAEGNSTMDLLTPPGETEEAPEKNTAICLMVQCPFLRKMLSGIEGENSEAGKKVNVVDDASPLVVDDNVGSEGLKVDFEVLATHALVAAIRGKCSTEGRISNNNDGSSTHVKIPWQHSLGYGSAFTAVIILGSQFGGLLYPFRHSLVYKICLTYLIGLAVGTLSGGGILHLMPHTFGMNETEEGNEFIFRASTILGGIYLFYIVERFLRDFNNWRKERRRLKKDMQRMQRRWEMKQAQTASSSSSGKPSIPPIPEIDVDSTPFAVGFEPKITVIPPNASNAKDGAVGKNHANAAAPIATSNGNAATISTESRRDDMVGNDHRCSSSDNAEAPALLTPTCDAGFPGEGSHDLLLLRNQLEKEEADIGRGGGGRRPSETHLQESRIEEESHRVRLPSHTHAQVNDTRHEDGEIATIAWIVIMAKAFSSFIDGLSMGAAFTESTLTGVKISIAIICEEFPHELGDIAILLNSGMKFKQALLCNCLAASPTFLGLCVGIAIGENTNANPWIFAIAAGMFLYIALVDMIPELNTLGEDLIRSGINHGLAYGIMHAGMISGFLLMLTMAIFGNDIAI